jgi:single-strand DNA-binding protein
MVGGHVVADSVMTSNLRPTGPVADLVRHLDGRTLRELAACADALRGPRFADPMVAAEELALMAAEGRRPTLSWWRRHLEPSQPTKQRERQTVSTIEHAPEPKTVRVGNLTRDPELRYSAKGSAWSTTALAVDHRVKRDDGSWEALPSDFYDLVCFGQLAESVAESLAKGDRVVVVGQVEDETWTGRDDKERTTHKLVADDIGPSLLRGTVQVDRTKRSGGIPMGLQKIISATTAEELFAEDAR